MTAFVLSVIPINDIAWPMLYFSNPCKPGPLGFYDPATCGMTMLGYAGQIAGIQWNGVDATGLMVKYLQQQRAQVANVSVSSLSNQRARYSMTLTEAGGTTDVAGVMTSFSFLNSAATRFMARNQYYNFAIMSGCSAPTGHLDTAVRDACAAILNTFRPRPDWLNAQVQATARY